jgi:outer membrane protein assembly factor BamB
VSQSGFISAFDLDTSKNIWTLPVGGVETPILSNEAIFINGNDGNLVAINRIKGNVIWHKKYASRVNINSYFSNEAIAIYKGPVLAASKLLLSDHHGTIRILDTKNGDELDTLSVGKLAIAPLVVDKKVFFLRADGDLLAYE